MLKIEKIGKNSEISLKFQKPTFFNKTLIIAFSLAFLMHLLAILIFHVGPFKLINNSFLPPAFVETDTFEQEFSATAKIETERKLMRFPLAPKIKNLAVVSLPNRAEFYDLEAFQQIDFVNHPFTVLENEFQHEEYFGFNEDENKLKNSLKLSQHLTAKFDEQKLFESLKPFGTFQAVFDIKVDNKTGQIFWLEVKHQVQNSISNSKQLEAIKTVLKNISFERKNGFITSGEIEISFNGESQ